MSGCLRCGNMMGSCFCPQPQPNRTIEEMSEAELDTALERRKQTILANQKIARAQRVAKSQILADDNPDSPRNKFIKENSDESDAN